MHPKPQAQVSSKRLAGRLTRVGLNTPEQPRAVAGSDPRQPQIQPVECVKLEVLHGGSSRARLRTVLQHTIERRSDGDGCSPYCVADLGGRSLTQLLLVKLLLRSPPVKHALHTGAGTLRLLVEPARPSVRYQAGAGTRERWAGSARSGCRGGGVLASGAGSLTAIHMGSSRKAPAVELRRR